MLNVKGSLVALVTPMHKDGSIDKEALHALVEWHIANGTKGLIIAGTTGESATLLPEEHFNLLTDVVKQVAKRVPVIAGTGTNSTLTTLTLTENAKLAGADACLIVTPYYNKPTQQGLYEHYRIVSEKIDLPIILYNVPGRTACDMLPETVIRLSKLKNIVGVKEATGKVERIKEIRSACGNDFLIYSGDDATTRESIEQGSDGVISVTANIAPAKMSAMCEAALTKNTALAKQLDDELAGLHKNLFLEANPIPAKWALQEMGKIQEGIRMPLLPLDKRYQSEVKLAMQQAGVL
jgi:4-hydroxy-tetrahydrodipicolinate synthase